MQTDKRGVTAVTTIMLLLIVACAFILSGYFFSVYQKNQEVKKFQSEHILFNGEWCNELRLCTPYRGDVDCFTVKKFEDIYNVCDIDNDTSTCSNPKYTYQVSCL